MNVWVQPREAVVLVWAAAWPCILFQSFSELLHANSALLEVRLT